MKSSTKTMKSHVRKKNGNLLRALRWLTGILSRLFWFGRRGASWWQRLLSLLVVLILVSGVSFAILWRHYTDPENLRKMIVARIETELNMRASISAVEFDFDRGLTLTGLRIYREGWDSLLRVSSCQIKIDVSHLLFNGPRPVEFIKLVQPRITLTENPETGQWNWPMSADMSLKSDWFTEIPDFELVDAVLARRELHDQESIFIAESPFELEKLAEPGACDWVVVFDLLDNTFLGGSMSFSDGIFLLNLTANAEDILDLLPGKWRQLSQSHSASGHLGLSALISSEDWNADLGLNNFSLDALEVMGLQDQDIRQLQVEAYVDQHGFELRDMSLVLPGLGDAKASARGRMQGFSYASQLDLDVNIEALRVPVVADESFLGVKLSKLQDRYHVDGLLNTSLKLQGSLAEGFSPTGSVAFSGLSARADEFPMQLEEIAGDITYDGGKIVFSDLRGVSGDTTVTMSGWFAGGGEAFDLRSHIENFDIGQQFIMTLEASSLENIRSNARNSYDHYSPDGLCNVDFRMGRLSAGSELDYGIDIHFDGRASAAYYEFPVRVHKLDGLIRISPGWATVKQLKGSRGNAPVQIDALISIDDKDDSFDMTIVGYGAELGDDIAHGIDVISAGEAGDYYRMFSPSGKSDFTLVLQRPPEGGTMGWTIDVDLKDGTMNYRYLPYQLTDVKALLTVDQNRVHVKQLTGSHEATTVTARGQVSLAPDGPIRLDVNAKALVLDKSLRELVENADEKYARLWDEFQPAGIADAHFEIAMNAGDTETTTGQKITWRLEADSSDIDLDWREFPLELKSVSGSVKADSNSVALENIRWGNKESYVLLNGNLAIKDDELQSVNLRMLARRLALNKTLLDAIPDSLGAIRDYLLPGGYADLDLQELNYIAKPEAKEGDLAQPAKLLLHGVGQLYDVSLAAGMDIKGIDARLDFDMSGVDKWALRCGFTDAKARFADRPVTNIRGSVAKNADINKLDISFDGSIFGGKVACTSGVVLSDQLRYELSLLIEGAKLSDMLTDAVDVQGKFNGTLDMTEVIGLPGSREGTGSFRVTQGRFARAPLIIGLTNMVFLQLPMELGFSEGSGDYFLRGQTVYCRRISLKGRDVSILGETSKYLEGAGKIDLNDQTLDLVFIIGPPALITGPVAELWLLTAPGVVKTKVYGPWTKPETKTAAFENIRKLLGEMGLGTSK